MKKLFTLLVGMLFCYLSFSQVSFTISEDSGNVNNEVTIDVRVSDAIDIASMQFSLNWDPNVAEFSSIENISTDLPELDIQDFGTPNQPSIDEGELALIWNPSNAQNFSIEEDNHLLFSLVLTLTGNECDMSLVQMTNQPRAIEIGDNNSNFYTVTSTDGLIEINGSNCEGGSDGIELDIANTTSASGASTCLEVTVDGFADIVNSEIGILWDSDLLDNASLQNSALVGAQVVPLTGSMRLLWQAPDLENPLTLANGTKLFDICFDVIAPSGSNACVTIGDLTDPTPFETSFSNFDEEIIPYTVDDGCVQVQGGSTDVTFYYEEQELILGSNVCIPFKVRNFSDISSFQFAMEFDDDVLNYTGTGFLNPALPIFADFFGFEDNNRVIVYWNDPTTLGVELDNETTIFELCFDVAGSCDETTTIDFTGNLNGGIEVTDSDVESIPYVLETNELTIICPCEINLVQAQSNDVSCNGGNDGKLTVEADGGNGNYTYSWSNAMTGNMISGLEAGQYTVSVTDGENCMTSMSFNVGEPSAINISATVNDETVSCNGSIVLGVSGGTGTFSYNWSDNGPDTGNRQNLCKGDYAVTVTDANNCTTSAGPYTVEPAPLQVADVTINNVSCNGGNDGSIELDITGGCAPYNVSPSVTNLSAGTYSLTITDSSTPPLEIVQSYPVDQPDAISIVLDNVVDTDINMTGQINVTVSGGTEPYTYNWSPNGADTEDIANLSSGDYTLEVTDANGCVVNSNTFSVGSTVLVIEMNLTDYNGFTNDCAGECNGTVVPNVVAGNGSVSYTINGQAASLPVMDLCAGVYEIAYTDEKGLTGMETIEITEPEVLTIALSDLSDVCSDGDNGAVTVTVTGGVEAYTYEYSGTTEVVSNPTTLPDGANTVLVTDANGCQVSNMFEIDACGPDAACYLGSLVITPNLDGMNDEFVISCLSNPDNTLYIYDRFGRTVYTQSDYDNTWTGLDSNGNELPENGYMWVLEVISSEGIRDVHKGTVTILRNSY